MLVISDSCFSGGLTRDINDLPAIKPDEAFLRRMVSIKSRSLMASGRDEPVADSGPDGHSVFAWAILRALSDTDQNLFTASELFFGGVQRAVAGNSEQLPVYLPIRNSGDIGGDFVFRRTTASSADVETRLAAIPPAMIAATRFTTRETSSMQPRSSRKVAHRAIYSHVQNWVIFMIMGKALLKIPLRQWRSTVRHVMAATHLAART